MAIGGNEAEWLTRKKRIDTKLRSLKPAWQIVPWREGLNCSKLACHAVKEIPTAYGPADYGFFVNGVFFRPSEAWLFYRMQPTVETVGYGQRSLTGLRNPCPSVSSVVQQEIVPRVVGLFAWADQLELRLTKALANQVAGRNQK
jgi:hypothetical protein